LSVGILPAEVCGCSKYPFLIRDCNSILMVEGQRPKLYFLERKSEPTGSSGF